MRWKLRPFSGECDTAPAGQMEDWWEQLPRLPNWDFRGVVSRNGDGVIFRKCMPDQFIPRKSNKRDHEEPFTIAFHSQPTKSVYSEIPCREDIYLFLKLDLKAFFAVGKSRAGLFIQDRNTVAARRRLLEWEAKHPYQISRLVTRRLRSAGSVLESPEELFRRYTHTALWGIGLRWPDKPFARRAVWPESLRKIGLNVQVLGPAAPSSSSS